MNPGSAAVWMSTSTVSPSATPLMIPVSHVCSAWGVMALDVEARGVRPAEQECGDRAGHGGAPQRAWRRRHGPAPTHPCDPSVPPDIDASVSRT